MLKLIEWTPKPVKPKESDVDRLKTEPVAIDLGFAGGLRGQDLG
jgi:hypothetical protein